MEKCWVECTRCCSLDIIWVHGHSQCRMCGLVLDACCNGEKAQQCPVPQTIAIEGDKDVSS